MLDLCHLVNILTNTNNISKVYFYHLANTLTNTDSILKMEPCHLANNLTNTNDKTDDCTKKEVWLRLTNSSFFVIR